MNGLKRDDKYCKECEFTSRKFKYKVGSLLNGRKIIKDLGMIIPTIGGRAYHRVIIACLACGIGVDSAVSDITFGSKYCKKCGHDKVRTHGLSEHWGYGRYLGMLDRCYNSNNKGYSLYGGRGIKVSKELQDVVFYCNWVDETFAKLPKCTDKSKLSVDRIDNDKGYYVDNLRLTNNITQTQNRGISRHNTSGYTGVSFSKQRNKWEVEISGLKRNAEGKYIKKRLFLKTFTSKLSAVKARNDWIDNHPETTFIKSDISNLSIVFIQMSSILTTSIVKMRSIKDKSDIIMSILNYGKTKDNMFDIKNISELNKELLKSTNGLNTIDVDWVLNDKIAFIIRKGNINEK